MRALAAMLLLSSCATVQIQADRERAAMVATAPIREWLLSIPVEYLDGMPLCGGHMPGEVVTGCWYPVEGKIEIAKIDWSKEGAAKFRYEDSQELSLVHEYQHAVQSLMGKPCSHPVGTVRKVIP